MGIHSLYGFGIFFLIPFLLWFQRSRWKVRDIVLSVSPIIEPFQNITRPSSKKVNRLSRRWRYALLAMAFLFFSLAFNGLYLRNMEDIPGEWLVVMDNAFSAHTKLEGKSLYKIGVEDD